MPKRSTEFVAVVAGPREAAHARWLILARTALNHTPLPVTAPGQELTITVPCIAQFVEGTSRAVFKMTDSEDRLYFPHPRYTVGLQVQVTVVRELEIPCSLRQSATTDHDLTKEGS